MTNRPAPLLLADIVAELERRIKEVGEILETIRSNTPAYHEACGAHRTLVDVKQWLLEQA